MRDNFNQQVKRLLAKRVGYLCSNPDCRRHTIWPNASQNGVTNIGVAAHICAASPKDPRYNANMTSKERKSFENGIWLCQNCAHMIDTDTVTYTVDLLKQWKQRAEAYAQEKLSINNLPMNQTNSLTDQDKNTIIGSLRIMKEYGLHIRNKYGYHTVGYVEKNDIEVYKLCVSIFNASIELNSMEIRNHMQLHRMGIDAKILEISDMLPEFCDENQDGYRSNLIATDFDFIKFFASNEGDLFIRKCEELITDVENM